MGNNLPQKGRNNLLLYKSGRKAESTERSRRPRQTPQRKMKTTLTAEQSAELIKHGVGKDKASLMQDDDRGRWPYPSVPIFTLADVCALLPKGVIHNGLSCKLRITSWYDEPYFAGYENQIGKYIMGNPYDAPFSAEELIDAIYELLLWAIGHGHIDLTK